MVLTVAGAWRMGPRAEATARADRRRGWRGRCLGIRDSVSTRCRRRRRSSCFLPLHGVEFREHILSLASHGRRAVWAVQRPAELPEAYVRRPDAAAGPSGGASIAVAGRYAEERRGRPTLTVRRASGLRREPARVPSMPSSTPSRLGTATSTTPLRIFLRTSRARRRPRSSLRRLLPRTGPPTFSA